MWKTEFITLNDKRGKWRFILLTGLLTFLFINLFEPFDTYSSTSSSILTQFLEILIACVGMIGGSAIAHFGVRKVFRLHSLTYLIIVPWFFLELMLISITWSVLSVVVDGPESNFFNLIGQNYVQSIFLVLLPYWASLMILHTRQQLRQQKDPIDPDEMIAFREKSGKEKVSIQLSNILFLESSDNYVIVHFLESGSAKTFTLRNTLKNLELELAPYQLVRCHRSFIVNTVNVVRKEKNASGYLLFMKGSESTPVPVSKSYTSELAKLSPVNAS